MKCEFQDAIQQLERKPGDHWSVVDILGDNDEIIETHVVPIGDADGHQQSFTCHCEPYIEFKDEDGEPLHHPVIAHNAFDGRHIVEEASQILDQ